MRRDAVLRNLPESAFSTERLSRISLAAPEFVGALPRVHEEVTSQTSKSQSILPDTPSELSSGLEGELCRAALDHIARGFDHVAMVSELLQEALDTLGASHRETKQRRAVWLHAALGNAFSKAEPVSLDVEAARHLDVALKWYEDNETLMCSGIATAWAWSRAFLLEHLGQCALRLGNSSLCITVFFKLAHKDLRDYLSRPTVAIAAQRDALKLLTHGALDDRANTALLRGFSTARFGESQSQIKDSAPRPRRGGSAWAAPTRTNLITFDRWPFRSDSLRDPRRGMVHRPCAAPGLGIDAAACPRDRQIGRRSIILSKSRFL